MRKDLHCGEALARFSLLAITMAYYAAINITANATISVPVMVVVVGPAFDQNPFERVVVPNDFPCNELHSTAREIFAIPASVKTELRMMPSNVIVAEGFTLLSSDAMDEAGTSAVAVGDAGVTNGAVVQLFFLANTPSADP